MSLIQRNNCVGIDCAIQSFQSGIYAELGLIWGVSWNCYPRVYKNPQKDENGNVFYKPEYIDGNYEYNIETLFDDKSPLTSFFVVGDVLNFTEGRPYGTASLIFSCDITKLYPLETMKADERMHVDIMNAITELGFSNWEPESVEIGFENVYREFRKDGLEWSSLSNRHIVRFNFSVNYSTYC